MELINWAVVFMAYLGGKKIIISAFVWRSTTSLLVKGAYKSILCGDRSEFSVSVFIFYTILAQIKTVLLSPEENKGTFKL